MSTTSRQTLYNILGLTRPGLSASRETCEQSSCYVFADGWVNTFNEEIACRMPCDIGVAGAVTSKGVLDVLERMPDDNVDVSETESHVVFKGSGRRLTVAKQQEVTLPIHLVPYPSEWFVLPDGLMEACTIAAACTRKDHDKFLAQCVRIGPGFVEACDNERASRVQVAGLDADILVRGTTIKAAADIHPTEWGFSEGWVHFTNQTGIVFSCRSHQRDYPDLNPILSGASGEPLALPGSLAEAVERAQKMSALAIGDDFVTLRLRTGEMLLVGEGVSGKYEERMPVTYNGPSIAFTAPPAMILELAKSHTQVYTDGTKISVVSTNVVSVMSVKGA